MSVRHVDSSHTIKKGNNAQPEVNDPLGDTRPSARTLAPGFSAFDPRRYLNKYWVSKAKRETVLEEDAQAALQDPTGALRSWTKPGDWLVGIAAALDAIMGSVRLRREFRPIFYGIGCLLVFLIVATCGGVYLLVSLLTR
jgi:hypothetical protein